MRMWPRRLAWQNQSRLTADDIKSTVERAGNKLNEDDAAPAIAEVLGMSYTEDDALNICKNWRSYTG